MCMRKLMRRHQGQRVRKRWAVKVHQWGKLTLSTSSPLKGTLCCYAHSTAKCQSVISVLSSIIARARAATHFSEFPWYGFIVARKMSSCENPNKAGHHILLVLESKISHETTAADIAAPICPREQQVEGNPQYFRPYNGGRLGPGMDAESFPAAAQNPSSTASPCLAVCDHSNRPLSLSRSPSESVQPPPGFPPGSYLCPQVPFSTTCSAETLPSRIPS